MVVSGIIYMIFGKSNVQSWNEGEPLIIANMSELATLVHTNVNERK